VLIQIITYQERVIDMMEETLQISVRAQRSTQMAPHRKTFLFGLRPSNDVYAHQVARSPQIQCRQWDSSDNLKPELRARCDPIGIPCTYHKGAWKTLHDCRLRKKIDQERTAPRTMRSPTSPDGGEFQKVRIHISPND
jgi:hypothetical protein